MHGGGGGGHGGGFGGHTGGHHGGFAGHGHHGHHHGGITGGHRHHGDGGAGAGFIAADRSRYRPSTASRWVVLAFTLIIVAIVFVAVVVH